jgi:hypothetical protein
MAKDTRKVEKVRMGEVFNVCEACGYSDGFHNMFRKTSENGQMHWLLICPNCSTIYDIGLAVPKV